MLNEVVYSNLGDINGCEFIVRMRQHIRNVNEVDTQTIMKLTLSSYVVHQKCSSSTQFPNTRVRIKKNQKAKDNHTKGNNYTRIKQATGW